MSSFSKNAAATIKGHIPTILGEDMDEREHSRRLITRYMEDLTDDLGYDKKKSLQTQLAVNKTVMNALKILTDFRKQPREETRRYDAERLLIDISDCISTME
jgi:hypothetical protein